ncbi:hypothetical protein QTH97_34555 [Variovorax sp. J22R24]|uniref:hypothetical protein n=1 Tax=Variovorax gracilis TaxID=3053502 RepID=UPI0025753D72|nr:hypothetical protein [Variovorax sp. J22R24]MDM0110067.1 hypothetical protein [Variovorax sp. J22R24]
MSEAATEGALAGEQALLKAFALSDRTAPIAKIRSPFSGWASTSTETNRPSAAMRLARSRKESTTGVSNEGEAGGQEWGSGHL